MRSRRVAVTGCVVPETDMLSEPGIIVGHLNSVEEAVGYLVDAQEGGDSLAQRASEHERLAVASIYGPIERQMVRVEERLDRLIDSAPSSIDKQMAHALKGGGKRLRPALTLLAGSFRKGDTESLVYAATAIELLHTASLVHDDTVDNALLRRARLTVNRLWGSHDAVFLGDYLCAASAYMAAETADARAMALFSRTLSDLCRGAIGEYGAKSHYCREEYFQTIGGKTAALFRTATESGALLSGAPRKVVGALKEYGCNLGMAFQIVDDIHDVDSDLARGILNLPALLVLEGPRGSELRQYLRRDGQEGLRWLANEVRNTGVLVDCRQIARRFHRRACAALAPLPRNAAYESLVGLAAYLTERDAQLTPAAQTAG